MFKLLRVSLCSVAILALGCGSTPATSAASTAAAGSLATCNISSTCNASASFYGYTAYNVTDSTAPSENNWAYTCGINWPSPNGISGCWDSQGNVVAGAPANCCPDTWTIAANYNCAPPTCASPGICCNISNAFTTLGRCWQGGSSCPNPSPSFLGDTQTYSINNNYTTAATCGNSCY